jgi:hypothetical protein
MPWKSALSCSSRCYEKPKQNAQSWVRPDGHRYASQRSFSDQPPIKVLVACVHCSSA